MLLGLTLWAQELLLPLAVPTVVQACTPLLWLLPWQAHARTARLAPTLEAQALQQPPLVCPAVQACTPLALAWLLLAAACCVVWVSIPQLWAPPLLLRVKIVLVALTSLALELSAALCAVLACILQLWLLPWPAHASAAQPAPTPQALASLCLLHVLHVEQALIPLQQVQGSAASALLGSTLLHWGPLSAPAVLLANTQGQVSLRVTCALLALYPA